MVIAVAERGGQVVRGAALTTSFRGDAEIVNALRGVDITIDSGEILGISGASGSGKSNLLAVLCGWEDPDAGELEHAGGIAADLPVARRRADRAPGPRVGRGRARVPARSRHGRRLVRARQSSQSRPRPCRSPPVDGRRCAAVTRTLLPPPILFARPALPHVAAAAVTGAVMLVASVGADPLAERARRAEIL
jgi:energy-coupling factor transporter ATP-binding protein EcfA2